MENSVKVNLKEIDPREILGPIAHIYRSNVAYMAKELDAYRVGSGQFEFLMFLYCKDGVSQETIARTLKVSKATSARAIQNLEKEGYVHRERDESDLRAYKVYLTGKGKEMRDIIFKKQTAFISILFSDFTFEEKEIFRLLIHKAVIKLFEPGFEPPSDRPNDMK
ncbi:MULTISPECIES: MarR family winged helix-turn-helix transcriptional regulator [Methanosarcina]|uniref:Transcriptional regulator, MarR family n=3 Tax=Methanosarcina barkeri TaxID=2208 RepID=A0A0E3LN12_METBA|nr:MULTISPECIES: MarR family winged helix-turn-helix transcriptional regulator [Methanosarcina]AKB53966.1 Transcriptional regulator, MarR family [Methanosarcina barkeri MS]AKB57958.1 Transcriptional regulator, MarR family [Methanosarcina barkeri 227]AKJ39657.1 MarR family transcriptional regulator [Methanosarcina barkeri CM1]OED02570.1 MarR family transcriptional regulator [Methanosarcina sp. A14]